MEPNTGVADGAAQSEQGESLPSDGASHGDHSYQQLLRAAGAILDRDHAGLITVMEVADGFLVRRQVFRNTHVETAVTHLTFDGLVERMSALRETRASTTVVRGPCLWSGMAPSHQDFFRSFGFELDDIGANAIVFDEMTESLLVAYERSGEQRSVVLTRSNLEDVLNEAVRRRKLAEDATLSQRLGITLPGNAPALRDLSSWAPMRDDVRYGPVLRELGDVLDQRGAQDVCLLETPDGISARYRVRGKEALSWEHFKYESLEREVSRHERKFRVVGRPRIPTHDRYRSLLQGLGHELQRVYATGLLMCEVNGTFTVTFEYVDSSVSYSSMKGYATLEAPQQDELVNGARSGRWAADSVLTRRTA